MPTTLETANALDRQAIDPDSRARLFTQDPSAASFGDEPVPLDRMAGFDADGVEQDLLPGGRGRALRVRHV